MVTCSITVIIKASLSLYTLTLSTDSMSALLSTADQQAKSTVTGGQNCCEAAYLDSFLCHNVSISSVTGAAWEHQSQVEAQAAVRLCYGLGTAVQEQRALQQAFHQMRDNVYGRDAVLRS